MSKSELTYKRHKLSEIWGDMPAPEFSKLKADIKKNGILNPIIVIEDGDEVFVLDGWHRYKAALAIGADCPESGWSPEDGSPVDLVLSANLHRRNLTPKQRALAVVKCRKFKKAGRPKATPSTSQGTPSPEQQLELPASTAEMAAEAQVSPRTITDARAVEDAGLSDAVTSGDKTLADAAAEARGTPAKKKAAKKKAKKKAAMGPQAVEPDQALEDAISQRDEALDRLSFVDGEKSPVSATREKKFREYRTIIVALKSDLAVAKKKFNESERENKALRKKIAKLEKD